MSLAKLKEKIELQKARPKKNVPQKVVGETKVTTPIKLKDPAPTTIPTLEPYQAEALVRSCENVLKKPLPKGYSAIGKNQREELLTLKGEIIRKGICSLDYETDGDPDDDTQDPQDHQLVGVSMAHTIGTAYYMPIAHISYGANWDKDWYVANFLKPILEHPDVLIIAHNIKFEHQVSILNGIDMFPKTVTKKVMDTMLMVKALSLPENVDVFGDVIVGLKPATKALLADESGLIHGLLHVDDIKSFKETVGTHTWEEPTGEFYKSGKNKGLPKTLKKSRSRTFGELPVDKHSVDYGCSDADWALGLYFKLLPFCISEGILDVLYELDVPFMMALGEYELAGWTINPDRLKAMGKVADDALEIIEPKLYEELIKVTEDFAEVVNGEVIVPAIKFPQGEWRGQSVSLEIKTPKPFNWGSRQHLGWLFFKVLNVDRRGLARSKKTGLLSTNADNLDLIIEGYAGDSEFIKVLKEKMKYDKIKSTYVNGILPFCREDTQKIHTNLNLVSTWRLSSKKPNLQNIPRPDNDPMGIREVFEAPSYDINADYSQQNPFTRPVMFIIKNKLSGETFYIASDYSQIELKVLAWFAGEQSMIDTLANGGDLHAMVAWEVFKLPCTVAEVKTLYKPHRYRAKKVNFGIVYGMTEYGLSKDREMGMTLNEAKVFIQNYLAKYVGVKSYANEMIAFARENGYVETMFGHRRPIPDINHHSKFIRQSAENKAMNTPIQGSASDIIRKSMVDLKTEISSFKPFQIDIMGIKEELQDLSFLKSVMQIHDELIIECPVEYAVEGALAVKQIMERPIEGFSDIMPIVAEPAIGKIWKHALDLKIDKDGQPYVKALSKRKEATDVLISEIQYALPLYEKAGIEVRVA